MALKGLTHSFSHLQECPVEYEFLQTVKELENKRTFKVLHGTVMRSGNTTSDIGKPAIDPHQRENPLLVLKEHIVVNDIRILDILKEYDTEQTYSVSQNEFASALEVGDLHLLLHLLLFLISIFGHCCVIDTVMHCWTNFTLTLSM